MKATKLRETGRRDVPEDSAPMDEAESAPAVGDPAMADVGAASIAHANASIDRALDEIAAGHAEGMSSEDLDRARRGTLDLWTRRGRPEGALLPLWLETVEHLSKGRPKTGSVAEGLPRNR